MTQIFIQEDLYDVYKEALIKGILKMDLGNPEEESTFIGPLTNKEDLFEAI